MSEPLRLFLVENDEDVALLIRRCLERAGHQVTRCRTGADALIVLGQGQFDLVLLDQFLDDMLGLDLLRLLAREGIAVPVLMVTVEGKDTQLATRVLHAGALDYVVKDPSLAFLGELPGRVREAVTRHRLERESGLLVQALESAHDGILITDLQGKILKVNQALEGLSGYRREELIGQTPRLFKSGAHPPAFYEQMWRAVLARGSWRGELTNRRSDGGLWQTSMTISPIVDPQGRLTHFVAIQQDVTERKQLERQLLQAQKMKSVGVLAGGVAHEFNNLLQGISGYATLGLREPGVSPDLREFLEHVLSLSERGGGLTRQLLAFARKPTLVRQPTEMGELVRTTAALVRRTLHLEVAVDVPPAPPRVQADASQLQEALVNLALNARDAVGRLRAQAPDAVPAPVTFRLREAAPRGELLAFPQSVPPGEYAVLEVQDHGAGMTPEVLQQAVDPFFTTKEVGQGPGLGLAVVFGIVQGHQGRLTIASAPGRGTTVRLYLPRLAERAAAPPPAAAPVDAEVVEPESAPGRSILVIDDEEAVLDVVRRFLEIAGHQVQCAGSAAEALQVLDGGSPVDLVILDLMMPREDAAVTFGRLRQRRPGVPVLLCTGLAEADPVPRLLQQEATGLIRKPFRMNELWYAVRQALGARKE